MRVPWAVSLAWASPASLVGVLLCPFFRRRRVVDGVFLCEGASWPRRLGWRYRAIALGHVVLSVDEIDQPTLDHERAHVAQYETWGIVLWPAYALAALWARIMGRHHYRDNYFEVTARRRSSPGD